MQKAEGITARSYYLDMKKYKKNMEKGQTPNTPAISVLYSLKAALDNVEGEGGFKAHRKRHEKAAEKSRKFVKEIGYKVFSEKGFESPTITGFVIENADEIRKRLYDEHQLVTARDFGKLKGKFFRICHIGNFDDSHLDYAFDAIRKVINE